MLDFDGGMLFIVGVLVADGIFAGGGLEIRLLFDVSA